MSNTTPGAAPPRAESIDRIIEATLEAFAELGYEGASIKIIAERAGVSRSLLHYHFRSKEDLVMHAVRDLAARIMEELGQRAAGVAPGLARLLQTGEDVYELLVASPVRAAFVLELFACANHNEMLRTSFEAFWREITELIGRVMIDALGGDATAAGIPIARVVPVVEASLLGLSVKSALSRDPERVRQAFEDLIDLLRDVLVRAA